LSRSGLDVGAAGSYPAPRGRQLVSDASDPAELVVKCECGFEARGPESELVPLVQKHGRDVHNMEATREQVLAMARPA
jgi:predicted small metal-binding protein